MRKLAKTCQLCSKAEYEISSHGAFGTELELEVDDPEPGMFTARAAGAGRLALCIGFPSALRFILAFLSLS